MKCKIFLVLLGFCFTVGNLFATTDLKKLQDIIEELETCMSSLDALSDAILESGIENGVTESEFLIAEKKFLDQGLLKRPVSRASQICDYRFGLNLIPNPYPNYESEEKLDLYCVCHGEHSVVKSRLAGYKSYRDRVKSNKTLSQTLYAIGTLSLIFAIFYKKRKN